MNNLIIVDGVSGVWKEDFSTYVNERLANTVIIKKYSDRKPRNGENTSRSDLYFLGFDDFKEKKFDYEYSFNGHKYGIFKNDIEKMRTKDNVFIIIRNHDIISKIINDFSEIFNVVTIFVYVGLELILPRYDSWYGEDGKRNLQDALIDYYRHPNIYEHILIYNEQKSDFYRLMDNVISQKNDVVDDFVFLIMSMADVGGKNNRKSRFVRKLYSTIQDSLSCYNLKAFRVDAPETDGVVQLVKNNIINTIDNKILNCIKKAKLIIADLSFSRPNCYFEIGYALALNKKVILIADRKSEIHFDIEHHNIFKYKSLDELSTYLRDIANTII